MKNTGWDVVGTTRTKENAEHLERIGIAPVIWPASGMEQLNAEILDGVSSVLISTPPGEDGCPTLRAAGTALAEHASSLTWIGYLSTNGVYGDYGGAWVDEDSQLNARSARGRRRIDAEAAWRRWAVTHKAPLAIFRLPGIYGPGRSAFDAIRTGRAKRVYKKDQVFSRMHVDDIVGALMASMSMPLAFDVFNLADDEPAPPQDVISYACSLLGVEPPPLIPLEDADLSEMGKSFYADNKRVSTKRMKEVLKFKPTFPTYREGLLDIFRSMQGGER